MPRHALFLGVLLLAGCVRAPIEIDVHRQGEVVTADLFRRTWLGTRSGTAPCVRTIQLRVSGEKPGPVLWRSVARPGVSCVPLREVRVGGPIGDFIELVPLRRTGLTGNFALEVRGEGEGSQQFAI